MEDTQKIRKRIRFYGDVQGVGFRYRAKYAAKMYGATGWVENISDGSVEMEIQGSEDIIDSVILTIEKGEFIDIQNMDVKEIPVDEGERSFGVRYGW